MTVKVLLVGCGNMGHAMLSGWISAKRLAPDEIAVVEPNHELRERAARLGAETHDAAEGVGAATPDLVVLAVKPQVMGDVVPAYRAMAEAGATVLSVAAGTSIAQFEKMLGERTAIIRCMPNTPASIGQGMMVTVANAHVTADIADFVDRLLSANGKVARIEDERLMDAVTGVSGSGPAYVFHFIEALTAAGRQAGLPDDVARLLAMQTVHGAARLAAETGEDPTELRRQVTSPNGTTAAALDVLMTDDRLQRLLTDAVLAARDRSIELGR